MQRGTEITSWRHINVQRALIRSEFAKRARDVEQDLHYLRWPRFATLFDEAFRLAAEPDFTRPLLARAPSSWMTAAFTHMICGNPSRIFFQLCPSSLDA